MPVELVGTWKLGVWRRISGDGAVTYPLGADASGLLFYTAGGRMAVQLVAANRPLLPSDDPLGGSVEQRAGAYSTCLAYVGTYEVRDDAVVHRIEESLYPNWSGAEQVRPFTYDGTELVLRTPPVDGPNGPVVNELTWTRET